MRELAYPISTSARISSTRLRVSPIALAVLRLMTSSRQALDKAEDEGITARCKDDGQGRRGLPNDLDGSGPRGHDDIRLLLQQLGCETGKALIRALCPSGLDPSLRASVRWALAARVRRSV